MDELELAKLLIAKLNEEIKLLDEYMKMKNSIGRKEGWTDEMYKQWYKKGRKRPNRTLIESLCKLIRKSMMDVSRNAFKYDVW